MLLYARFQECALVVSPLVTLTFSFFLIVFVYLHLTVAVGIYLLFVCRSLWNEFLFVYTLLTLRLVFTGFFKWSAVGYYYY